MNFRDRTLAGAGVLRALALDIDFAGVAAGFAVHQPDIGIEAVPAGEVGLDGVEGGDDFEVEAYVLVGEEGDFGHDVGAVVDAEGVGDNRVVGVLEEQLADAGAGVGVGGDGFAAAVEAGVEGQEGGDSGAQAVACDGDSGDAAGADEGGNGVNDGGGVGVFPCSQGSVD